MIKKLLFFYGLLVVVMASCQSPTSIPTAKRGILDATYWNFGGDFHLKIQGEVLFQWEKFSQGPN